MSSVAKRKPAKTSSKQNRDGMVFIGAWVSPAIVEAVDAAVASMDLDRSKFLRRALEEKVARTQT